MTVKKSEGLEVILNATPEELRSELSTLNIGHLQSFKNNFIIMYESNRLMKEEIVKKVISGELTPEKADETLVPMYVQMQKIEDVVTVVTEVIKNLETK